MANNFTSARDFVSKINETLPAGSKLSAEQSKQLEALATKEGGKLLSEMKNNKAHFDHFVARFRKLTEGEAQIAGSLEAAMEDAAKQLRSGFSKFKLNAEAEKLGSDYSQVKEYMAATQEMHKVVAEQSAEAAQIRGEIKAYEDAISRFGKHSESIDSVKDWIRDCEREVRDLKSKVKKNPALADRLAEKTQYLDSAKEIKDRLDLAKGNADTWADALADFKNTHKGRVDDFKDFLRDSEDKVEDAVSKASEARTAVTEIADGAYKRTVKAEPKAATFVNRVKNGTSSILEGSVGNAGKEAEVGAKELKGFAKVWSTGLGKAGVIGAGLAGVYLLSKALSGGSNRQEGAAR